MADENKFGIEVSVDTKDASKKLDDLNKKADQTNKTFNKDNTFKADTAEAKTGLDDINKKLQNIENSLDNVEQKTSTAFSVGKLVIWFQVLKKIFGAVKAVADYALDAAQEMTNLSNTAQGLSISTNTLKAWETTFKSMGFDAKEADAALGAIQDRLTGQLLNPSVQVASAFAMMGVNLRKANGELRDADDILGEVAGKFKNFKPEYAIAIGAQIGLNRNQVIQMRNNPNYAKTLAEQKNNPVITSKEEESSRSTVEQSAKFSAELEKVRNDALMPLNATLKNDILPPLTKIADALSVFTGSAVAGTIDTIGKAFFKFGGPKDIIKSGLGKVGHVVSDEIGKGARFLSTKVGQQELALAGARSGMNSSQIAAMMKIANAEDPSFKNGPSDIKKSSAYGFFQITKDTMTGLANNNPGFNPNDWSPDNQVRAYRLLKNEFEGFAKKNAIDPNNVAQYRAFHNLGQSAYKRAIEMQRNDPNTTYGDVYKATDKTGAAYKDNPSLISQRLPIEGLQQPNASQSTSVTNNMINNNSASNITSSTNIGAVHVSANNPEQFAKELSNHRYLDRINNMRGQLA